MFAVRNNHSKCAQVLLENGANVNNASKTLPFGVFWTPLQIAGFLLQDESVFVSFSLSFG